MAEEQYKTPSKQPPTLTQTNSDEETDSKTQLSSVTKNTIKLPQFYIQNPESWFIIAEAQFGQKKLSDDWKFNHVIETLPESIAVSVIDVIKNAVPGQRYTTLKRAILDRMGLSEEQKLNRLLTDIQDMGDLKPSDFYRRLQTQIGESEMINPRLLKNFWIKRLPDELRTAIAAWSNSDIKDILPIADTIWTFASKSVYSVASTEQHQLKHRQNTRRSPTRHTYNSPGPSTSSDSHLRELERKIDQLTEKVAKLSTDNWHLRRRQFNRSRSNSRHRSKSKNGICYFHQKFGQAAKNCRSPCKFNSPSVSTSSNHPN